MEEAKVLEETQGSGQGLGTATARQRWALFCATKRDYRKEFLDREQASALLDALKVAKLQRERDFAAWHREAWDAAQAAGDGHTPTPMVVQRHANQLDDSSPVEREWHVPQGVCGFASCYIRGNGAFLRWAKREGKADGKRYYGGTYIDFPKFGQCYEKNDASARAFARSLASHGVDCSMESRLD